MGRRSHLSSLTQRFPLVSLSAAIIVVCSGQGANCQETEGPNAKYIHGVNTRHWGPFYVTPRLVATGGWDTNVNYSQDDPFRDSGFVVDATAEVLWPVGRRLRIIGNGTLTPNYFTSYQSARSLDRRGDIRAEFDVGPLTPFATVGASRAKQRFSTEIDDRLWRDETSKGAGLTARLTRKISLSGSWRQEDYTYEQGVFVNDAEVAQSLNHQRRTLDLELQYNLTRRTAFTATADVFDDTFVGTPEEPSNDLVRSYRYLAGVSFTPLSRIQGEFLAGWRHYPTGGGRDAPAYDGPALEVHLTVPFVGDGLHLAATRDIYYAVERSATISGGQRNSLVSSNYSGTFGVNAPLSLIVRFLGAYGRAEFLLPYEQDGVPFKRVDGVWSAGGSLLRRLGSRLAVGGTVTHEWRATNADGKDYQDTRYGLTVEAYP